MKKLNLFRKLSASVLAAFFLHIASAQDYPVKPISIVVPNPPGGIVDTSIRLLADAVTPALGQAVIVENRAGGSGNVAYQYVGRSKADGYTLLGSLSAFHVGNPSLFPSLPWSQSDFTPIALVSSAAHVVVVHPSVPANSLQELIQYLRANPGKLSYASQGNGSTSHIATEMFKGLTKTSILHIPYRGSGPVVQDLLAGRIQVFVATPPSVVGFIQSGKLKALAITGPQRHPSLPNVPTTSEAGLKDFNLDAWVGIFGPSAMESENVKKLTSAIKTALDSPSLKERAMAAGIELRYLTPTNLGELVKKDTERWGKTIKDAGIKPD